MRQVYFASGGYSMVYVLAMTGAPSDFQNNSANWTMFVDTFALDMEPQPQTTGNTTGGGGFMPGFDALAALAAVGVVAAVAVVARRGRRN